MKDRGKTNATTNSTDLEAGTLNDLPVTDEQATETKGGANPHFISASSTVTQVTGL